MTRRRRIVVRLVLVAGAFVATAGAVAYAAGERCPPDANGAVVTSDPRAWPPLSTRCRYSSGRRLVAVRTSAPSPIAYLALLAVPAAVMVATRRFR